MPLTLRLKRKPDPVLNDDELRVIKSLLEDDIMLAKHQMDVGRVSESVIRKRMYAEDALSKIEQAMET